MEKFEIPFGAGDSKLKGWEYTIPEDMEAEIKDGKVIVRKKSPTLTPFEQDLLSMLKRVYYTECAKDNPVSDFLQEVIKQHLETLLQLAKDEICKGCTANLDGYIKGQGDAEKDYQQGYLDGYKAAEASNSYHYPANQPPCFHGGVCTNPFMDCINCPMHSSGSITNTGTCKKD